MVIDSLEKIGKYLPEKYKTVILNWLNNVNKKSDLGDYKIAGDAIYARILSYPTKLINDCKIEAHNQYIDIQSTLKGEEGIQIYYRDNLEAEEEYDKSNDVIFFRQTEEPYVNVNVKEGYFAMLFPNEAHQPEISFSGKCQIIKKFVIKIRRDLFE